MPRSFRHNRSAARRAGPAMCDACDELTPSCVVTTRPAFGAAIKHFLCGECAVDVLAELRRQQRSFDLEDFPEY